MKAYHPSGSPGDPFRSHLAEDHSGGQGGVVADCESSKTRRFFHYGS
jgi:hypothetical protein